MRSDDDIRSYLICGTPRTGSTLLCHLLASTGIAGRPESYFRVPDEQSWADRWQLPRDAAGSFDYQAFVRAAAAAGRTPNGVFGARVMWGSLDVLVARLGAAHPDLAGRDLELLQHAFGPTRFVHLRREDPVAQAVSWARAEQTRFWQDGDAAAPGATPRFDFDQLRSIVRRIEEHHLAWRRWFAAAGVRPYEVWHEDLVADRAGVVSGILEFLGLPPSAGRAATAPDRRQSDDLNDEWIARYRAGMSH